MQIVQAPYIVTKKKNNAEMERKFFSRDKFTALLTLNFLGCCNKFLVKVLFLIETEKLLSGKEEKGCFDKVHGP